MNNDIGRILNWPMPLTLTYLLEVKKKMNNFEEIRVQLALAIGFASFLLVGIPRWVKNYRISKIIKYGKQNQTFIRAKIIPKTTKRYKDILEESPNQEHAAADYEYEINGHKKTYHLVGNACPAYLPMYYYKDKNDAHCENELERRQQIWQIPFLVGIAAGVIFMFLTN